MWKVLTALVQATILSLSISAGAQTTPDAQAILKKVNETYRNLKSYRFEYKTVSDSKTEREGLTSTTHNESLSRITAVRPDRIHVETQDSLIRDDLNRSAGSFSILRLQGGFGANLRGSRFQFRRFIVALHFAQQAGVVSQQGF